MSLLTWLGVALLGGIGAVARSVIGTAITRGVPSRLPLGTLVINLTGAFLLGLLTGLALTGTALLLAGTATLGAYTTFSAWMLEAHELAESSRRGSALAYVAISLVVGLGAAALGRLIGGHL